VQINLGRAPRGVENQLVQVTIPLGEEDAPGNFQGLLPVRGCHKLNDCQEYNRDASDLKQEKLAGSFLLLTCVRANHFEQGSRLSHKERRALIGRRLRESGQTRSQQFQAGFVSLGRLLA
jgi:hypothetical protein